MLGPSAFWKKQMAIIRTIAAFVEERVPSKAALLRRLAELQSENTALKAELVALKENARAEAANRCV
jgi:hypothetical protein